MKNIAQNVTAEALPVNSSTRTPDRWKSLPFLILMFSSSLPLNYRLEESHPMLVADVADLTREAAASDSTGSSILFVVLLVMLYLSAGAMVLHRPRAVGAMLLRQWPLVMLMLLIGASMAWSHNPEKVFLNVIHGLGTVFIAIAAALRYRHAPWALPRDLALVLGINMLLHLGAVLALPSYAIDWQGRWKGLATHPNTFGVLGFTTFWANSAVLICLPASRRYFHYLFALAGIAAVVGANSVTSMVTASCSVGAIWALYKLGRIGAGRNFYVGALLLAALAFESFKIVSSQIDLGWLFEMLGRDSNFTGRVDVWNDAIDAISRHPILGWSFDDHTFLIASEGMAYPSYHNGWLDMCVDGGIVSVLLFLCLLGTWLREFGSRGRMARYIAPYAGAFVLGYLVHNLTEASFVSPRGQMWQIFLVILLLSSCKALPPQAWGRAEIKPKHPSRRSAYVHMARDDNLHTVVGK